MVDGSELPTFGDKIAEWLGFQLPSVPMPQTIKNFDKAVGKLLLAAGENFEARVKANTNLAKAKGKIAIEGLYRTEEEKRKIENRASIVKVAVDDLNDSSTGEAKTDAQAEIDDDWLNLFARLAEDKSSEEIQSLFGRILAGEIRKPGSFALRTLQFISTLSKDDANSVSYFLSFALAGQFVPLLLDNEKDEPELVVRVLMEELGLASHPAPMGGLQWEVAVPPLRRVIFLASGFGVVIENLTDDSIPLKVPCQVLSKIAAELIRIANPPPTKLSFLTAVAQQIFRNIWSHRSTENPEKIVGVYVTSLDEKAPADLSRSSIVYRASLNDSAG